MIDSSFITKQKDPLVIEYNQLRKQLTSSYSQKDWRQFMEAIEKFLEFECKFC